MSMSFGPGLPNYTDLRDGKRDVAYGICLRYLLAATESGTLHTGSACAIFLLPCRAKPASMRRGSSTT